MLTFRSFLRNTARLRGSCGSPVETHRTRTFVAFCPRRFQPLCGFSAQANPSWRSQGQQAHRPLRINRADAVDLRVMCAVRSSSTEVLVRRTHQSRPSPVRYRAVGAEHRPPLRRDSRLADPPAPARALTDFAFHRRWCAARAPAGLGAAAMPAVHHLAAALGSDAIDVRVEAGRALLARVLRPTPTTHVMPAFDLAAGASQTLCLAAGPAPTNGLHSARLCLKPAGGGRWLQGAATVTCAHWVQKKRCGSMRGWHGGCLGTGTQGRSGPQDRSARRPISEHEYAGGLPEGGWT
jgi:hypothetical protein